MPTKSRPQIGLVLVIVTIAVYQMSSVTLAALPTNKVSNSLNSATSYLNPFFTQSWRLFAPNPISDDRTLWFRGEYADESGDTKTTGWIDWTSVELDLLRHQLVGGRAGYITNKMLGALNTGFFALTLKQQEIAADDRDASLAGNTALRSKLMAAGGNPGSVDFYLRYESSATQLGTSVLEAAHPGIVFTAVRYRFERHPVVPYADRTLPAAQRQQSRPPGVIRQSGWRKPIQGSAAVRRSVASFFERHSFERHSLAGHK